MPGLGELIYTLDITTKQHVRTLEKCLIKLVKNELSCAFNSTCLKEGLLPKYTNIYIYIYIYI